MRHTLPRVIADYDGVHPRLFINTLNKQVVSRSDYDELDRYTQDQCLPVYRSTESYNVFRFKQVAVTVEQVELKDSADNILKTVYTETVRHVSRTPAEQNELEHRCKKSMCEFIIHKGIPIRFFTPVITVDNNRDTYVFDIEDLCSLDLFKYPLHNNPQVGIFAQYKASASATAISVPAVTSEGYVSVELSGALGVKVVGEYINTIKSYLAKQSELIKYIMAYKLHAPDIAADTVNDLWQNVFGTTNYTGTIETVLMK